MNHVTCTPTASAFVSPDFLNDGSHRPDRREQFSQLLSQALEQQHDGALGVLLEGARSDSDPRMILAVGQQYSRASPEHRDIIDHWLDTLSLEQRLDVCEEREFVDHADLFRKLLQTQRNGPLEDLLYGTLYAGKSGRYFEEIGRQRAHASDQQKALMDNWQKELSFTQRGAYLKGLGELHKLNAIHRHVSDFVDDKTFLRLQLTSKHVGHYLNKTGRWIAIQASQLHQLSGEVRSKVFWQLLSDTQALSDPHQRMLALEGLARAVDARPEVGISEFEMLMNTIVTLGPEFQVTPLTALAPRLASWKFAWNYCPHLRHSSMLDAIGQLPQPEWRFAPLEATVRATTNSPMYSRAGNKLLELFQSIDVEGLPDRDLRSWTHLLSTYCDSGHAGPGSTAKLVKKTRAVIEKLQPDQRATLLTLLPNEQR